VFNTQIVHYSPLKDRYEYLSRIDTGLLSLNFITEKNAQILNQKFTHTKKVFGISQIKYGFNLGVNARALASSRRSATIEGLRLLGIGLIHPKYRYVMTGSIPPFTKLTKNQLEVSAMHVAAIKAGYESNMPWILVLEDDARISGSIEFDIESVCKAFQKARKVFINLNSGAGMIHTKSDPKPNAQGIYRVRPLGVRCTTSYLINRMTAAKLLELFRAEELQDWLPIDVQMQIALQKIKAKTYWQDPPMFIQGSEDGSYSSNLR
jgi:hypothetical protein